MYEISKGLNYEAYYLINYRFAQQRSFLTCVDTPWIIERLDRKLADAIGSNIVENCDVTLSRAIQPLAYIRRFTRLTFDRIFHISAFDYTDCPCFE